MSPDYDAIAAARYGTRAPSAEDLALVEAPAPGATRAEWDHFATVLGLERDLLPVVSNLKAKISASSAMKQLGKTPSHYNAARRVVGIPEWTSKRSTAAEVARWKAQPDLGICVQTRNVRAIDVDVVDTATNARIAAMIATFLGHELPRRERENAVKFLLAFRLEGEFKKRIIETPAGRIEFLADGQQFIAAGTHPSGARYAWRGGLPAEIPALSAEDFERAWSALTKEFGSAPDAPTPASPTNTGAILEGGRNEFLSREAYRLRKQGLEPDAIYPVISALNSSACTPPLEEGEVRSIAAGKARVEPEAPVEDDFEKLGAEPGSKRFEILDDLQARRSRAPLSWIIKHVLPRAELVVLYGEPGSGKSFAALDIAACVARGVPWRGLRTKQGRVLYIAAEGRGGFLWRVEACCRAQSIERIGLDIITDAPNLFQGGDAKALLAQIKARGQVDLLVVDTLAAVTPGANENSGEDMGLVLDRCKRLARETGATVLLIHHSGKDAAKGARGWSGLKAAADAELEVLREGDLRQIRATKQKDGQDGMEFPFGLEVVELGVDEDNEAITSCVVKHITPGPDVPKLTAGKKAGGRVTGVGAYEAVVLQVAHDLTALGGGEIDKATLITEAAKRIAHDPERSRDRRREYATRALDSLQARGRLRIDDLAVRITGSWGAKK